jgi:hypothetical protein
METPLERIWREWLGQALSMAKEFATFLAGALALLSVFAYAATLRYYDRAMAAAGWPGMPVPVDKGSVIARSLVAGVLLVSTGLMPFLVAMATKAEARQGGKSVFLLLLPLIAAGIWGVAYVGPGTDIGLSLVAGAVLGLVGWGWGIAAGQWTRRRERVRARRQSSSPASAAVPRPRTLTIAACMTVVPGLVFVAFIGTADRAARKDIAAIRNGGPRDVVWQIVAPLDLRLVGLQWIDPAVRAAVGPVADGPWLFVGHRDGRTLLLEASPAPGKATQRLDVPQDSVVLREPAYP